VTALCFEGPPEDLTKTEKCQPALFVTSMAAHAAFARLAPASFTPAAAAGLSLGELTALVVAGALSLADGLYLVKARGEAMGECAAREGGAMLAVVGLSKEALEPVCRASGAWGANFNAADQIVLSGTVEAIAKAEALAKAAGAKRAVKLEVAGAFHSPLMQPAAEACRQALANVAIRPPRFPVISNVTGEPVEDPEAIRRLLVEQIVKPVLWEASMRYLLARGVTHFIEFPPARILTGLLRRIDKASVALMVNTPQDLEALPMNEIVS
jgi:[acyl-carrier-protein] S-malonyltransferase